MMLLVSSSFLSHQKALGFNWLPSFLVISVGGRGISRGFRNLEPGGELIPECKIVLQSVLARFPTLTKAKPGKQLFWLRIELHYSHTAAAAAADTSQHNPFDNAGTSTFSCISIRGPRCSLRQQWE